VPKRAKWLTIPLTDEARHRRARSMHGLFFFRSRRGFHFLARRIGQGALELVYLLMQSVRVPARPFFRPTIDRLEKRIPIALQRAYRNLAARMNKKR